MIDEIIDTDCTACEQAQKDYNELDKIAGDLAIFVVRLSHALHKASPNNELPKKALDYLHRCELKTSLMRHNNDFSTTADYLIEYANNPGYSHADYADVMKKAAGEIAAALPAMREYARNNPRHRNGETWQDPCGVHAWLQRNDATVMRYRLLERGEQICADDERLLDDCQTWEPISKGWEIGKNYDPCAFVPIRRKERFE